jgi:hypothetical protein
VQRCQSVDGDRALDVGGYIRVSSRRQRDESDSPASQRQRLKDAGCTVFYEDLAVSGFRLSQRRLAVQFQQMWEAIATRRLKRLVATRLDRYARRDEIVLELADHCERHGVEFLSLSSGVVDTTSATGWLNVKMQLVFAEHYSRQLSENVKQGFAGLHRQGIPACSGMQIPWHLQRHPSNRHGVIKGPGWADARYALERLLADEWTLTDAANFIHPRHGVMRSHVSVKAWLRRPSLVGHMVRRQGGSDEVVMRDCWPALATEVEQLQVLRILERRGRVSRAKGQRRAVRPLSGLCVCSACGGGLRVHGPRDGQQYLRCGSPRTQCTAPMAPVEAIERQIHGLLSPRVELLLRQAAQQRQLISPPPEAATWMRELQMREAIPAEFRQAADQQRIGELQGLIAAATEIGQTDNEALVALQMRILDAAGWFNRPDVERNTDLRQVLSTVVVDTGMRAVQRIRWTDGTEQAVKAPGVKACHGEPGVS